MKKHLIRILFMWAFFAVIIALFATNGVKMAHISRDPYQLADFPLYYGLLSNLGVLIWITGGAVPLFASFLIQEFPVRKLLRYISILTIILVLDDFFLIHDEVFPNVLHISGMIMYAFYAVVFSLFFIRFWAFLKKHTDIWILILSFFLMGVSIIIDLEVIPGGIDVEDSFKLCGILTYVYYWVACSYSFAVGERKSQA